MEEKLPFVLLDIESERRSGHKWFFGPFQDENDSRYTTAVEIGYVELMEVDPGDRLHYHRYTEEYYIVLSGKMEIQVQDRICDVLPMQVFLVRPSCPHIIRNVEPGTRILLLKAPPHLRDKQFVSDSDPNACPE